MGEICRIDTQAVAPACRLDYWNEFIDSVFDGMVIDSDADRFGAQLLYTGVGRVGFMRAQSTSATVRRWHDRGGRSPNEHSLVLHLQNAGSCLNRQGGRETYLNAGDFTFCDGATPYSIELSPRNDMLVLDLPFDLVAEHVPDAIDRILDPVLGKRPQVRMFTNFLLTLWNECDASGPDAGNWVDGLEDVLLDLLALALRDGSQGASRPAGAGPLERRLLAIIQARLTDPELGTGMLAAEAGTSARTVQAVFARMGTTPTAFVLDRRLALAADRLKARPGARIIDIAYDAGFGDSAYFARRFRQRYGMSPREYRLMTA